MSKQLHVLHFTTHNEDCGIGKYQEQFLRAMSGDETVIHNEIFLYSPNKTKMMGKTEFGHVLVELSNLMKDFDILHIQHELSFFKHTELNDVLEVIKKSNKKSIVTVHTAPDAQYKRPHRIGLRPRSFLTYVREIRAANEFINRYVKPLDMADLVLVHNESTRQSLVAHGVSDEKIKLITMPIPVVDFTKNSNEIRTALKYQQGDIIFASVGFISPMKGVDDAIKALKYLPDNYKLAVVGGVHPNGDSNYLNQLCDLMTHLELNDRIYITGYVEDDEKLNALIRECDICVYPYDREYYANVSSAALNNALANHKPAVVYPTKSFVELNSNGTVVAITKSFNYYELARSITHIDIDKYAQSAKVYAEEYAYPKEAKKMTTIYKNLLAE